MKNNFPNFLNFCSFPFPWSICMFSLWRASYLLRLLLCISLIGFFYLAPFMYTHNVGHRSNFGNDFFRQISLQETETYQKVLHLLQIWHDSMLPFKLGSFPVDSCGRLVYLSYSISNLKNMPKMRFKGYFATVLAVIFKEKKLYDKTGDLM